jgi:hypothetical protein
LSLAHCGPTALTVSEAASINGQFQRYIDRRSTLQAHKPRRRVPIGARSADHAPQFAGKSELVSTGLSELAVEIGHTMAFPQPSAMRIVAPGTKNKPKEVVIRFY